MVFLLRNTLEKKRYFERKIRRNYTDISTYKPTGNLIYNTKMIQVLKMLDSIN